MTIDEAIKKLLDKAEEQEYVSQIIVELHREESEREHKDACDACAADCRQLAEWLTEAKKLLKAAVYDFSNMYDHIFDCDGMCDTCPIHGNRDTCDKWVHADEALKLIGEGGDA